MDSNTSGTCGHWTASGVVGTTERDDGIEDRDPLTTRAIGGN
jgi:hypothetical protein